MRQLKFLTVLATLLIIAIGCDDNSPTAPVVADPEPVPTVTDTFTGSFGMGETSCHVFTSANLGPAQLQITSLAPLQTLTVGLGLGNDDGDASTGCTFFALDNSVRVGDTLTSQIVEIRDFCVCIFDVGNVFPDQTVDYSFDVEHP